METGPFGKLMPGLDMLKNWMSSAGSSMPAMGAWMAPTLDPQELGKRIEELRTVQYWLEQNARLLATTIQTLEVQRMTLDTLHRMNVPMPDLAEAFKMPAVEPADPAADSAPEAAPARPAPPPEPPRAPPAAAASSGDAAPGAAPGLVDPMQWWGTLTQQFTEIAGRAVQEGAAAAGAVAEAARQAQAASASHSPEASKEAGRAAAKATGKTAGTAARTAKGKTGATAARKTAGTSRTRRSPVR